MTDAAGAKTVILNGVKNLPALPEGRSISRENFRFFASLRMTVLTNQATLTPILNS